MKSNDSCVQDVPAAIEKAGDRSWYLSQAKHAQRLLSSGEVDLARKSFEEILERLGEEPDYARATVMERVGRCYLMEGMAFPAAELFQRAMEVTEHLAASPGVKALQGVLQSSLGDAFRAAGQLDQARLSYEAALVIAESANDKRAKAVDLDHLGSLSLQEDKLEEAISKFELALLAFIELGERAPQAIARHHLGLAYQKSGRWQDAERHYVEAVRLMEACGDLPGVAGCRSLLGAVLRDSGRIEAAGDWYRSALEVARQSKNNDEVRRQLLNLARYLLGRASGGSEIRQLLEEALLRAGNSLDALVWDTYGLLADALEISASELPDNAARAETAARANNYRHIQEFGPRLIGTLVGLKSASGPTFGHAVILERLARCCLAGGRPRTAVFLFNQALESIQQPLSEGDSEEPVSALRGVVQRGLAEALQALGYKTEAKQAFEAALAAAQELGDLRGEAMILEHLGSRALSDGRTDEAVTRFQSLLDIWERLREREPEASTRQNLAAACGQAGRWKEAERHYLEAIAIRLRLGDKDGADLSRRQLSLLREGRKAEGAQIEVVADGQRAANGRSIRSDITIREEIYTDCVFTTNLLIDVGRVCRSHAWNGEAKPFSGDTVPSLGLGVRMYADERGICQFCLPPDEPKFEAREDYIIMRKSVRELTVFDGADVVWQLIRNLDGVRTADDIVGSFPEDTRKAAKTLMSALVASGAVDISGRQIGRYLHTATKKGMIAAGGLGGDAILNLASDGNYRTYENSTQMALSAEVPDRLKVFHSLTRARRSRRDYSGKSISREEFDALLYTACGITGGLAWQDREIKLRAYPSSGALYAVEIYPVAFSVDDLEPAIYHYAASDHTLDTVRPVTKDSFVTSILPVEREMVSGASLVICLVARFKRHEQKYGQGGYRMLVAEAGHISQNIVLAAVSLGLVARPFGGVFDSLINEYLGLDESEEQFLLSVLVGHADDLAK